MKCNVCSEVFVNNSDLDDHTTEHGTTGDSESDIIQLDGNISLDASSLSSESSFDNPSAIPILISSRTGSLLPDERRSCFNRNIRKDNRLLEAVNLPAFTVYNMRSLWSKIYNLADDIIERAVDISFLSEIWEKKENLKHQASIEELLELKGIQYISTPRPGLKRGLRFKVLFDQDMNQYIN